MRYLALMAVAATLVFAGCGSDDLPATGQTEGAADGPLTQTRYEQIESLYEAGIESEKAADAGELRTSTRILLRACDETDRNDRMLAAITSDCDGALSELHAIFGEGCSSAEACVPLARRGARAARQSVEAGREANEAIADEVDDAGCRDALVLPPRYLAALSDLAVALDGLATTIDEDGDIDAAQARVTRATAAMEALPTSRVMLKRFRQECAPSA